MDVNLTPHNNESTLLENNFKQLSNRIFLVIVVSGILLISFYIFTFWGTAYSDKEYFAQFGDFLGGVLNPILSFLTIVLLVFSLKYQLIELRMTREELANQSKEQAKNNQTQLELAKLNEHALILPSLKSALEEKKKHFDDLMSLGVSYRFDAYKAEQTTPNLSIEYSRGGSTTFSLILQEAYVENKTEIEIQSELATRIKATAEKLYYIIYLFDEYLLYGGSKFIVSDFALRMFELCKVLTHSTDMQLSNEARHQMNQLKKYTSL